MPVIRKLRSRSASRGQSITEFALLAPLMFFIMVAIFDLSRIYTTMMSVESAAREAADFGTELGAPRWDDGSRVVTVSEMRRRACVAASNLPDYVGIDADSDGVDENCSNPSFAHCLTTSTGGTCQPWDATAGCEDAVREPPCTVTVTLGYDFHLFVPFHLDFFGVQLGLPVSLSFSRDSTFAMTDINLASPSPSP